MIPYGRQDVSEEDQQAVLEVLRSSHLTQGSAVERFEQAVAQAAGAPHAVAVSSGTAALHVACLALDLGPGDRLWTVPNTYVASANCGLYCGAAVDFVDVHPETLDLDPVALERKLRAAAEADRLPQVVVPVHFAGRPCAMDAIGELSARFGFDVIEDASHALGAHDGVTPVGACRSSVATVFSFHPVKIITTGEGGVITTKDERLAARLRRLRSHGVTRNPDEMTGPAEGPWAYELLELGFNYRLTDIQAALGTSQLSRLTAFVERRNVLAARYRELLADLPLELPPWPDRGRSAFHLFVVRVAPELRHELFLALREAEIGVNLHYSPVHLQPLYRKRGFAPGDCPVSEDYARRAITLPLFPTLTEAEQDRVVSALRGFFGSSLQSD